MVFFELLAKKIGLSRIGRFPRSEALKKHITTPHVLIPINKRLMNQFYFIDEFIDHDTYIISDEKYLKRRFLLEKFKNSGVIYTHTGTLDKFQEVINKNPVVFNEYNIIALIPFNVPTTCISKEFAENEIKNYIQNVETLLEKHSNLNFGLTIKLFEYHELIDLFFPLIKSNEKIKILNFSDLFNNLSNFRGIIKTIVKVKQELDNNLAIIASGRITPKHYPILVYLGIDIIDCSYLLYLSSKGFYDTIEYMLPIYKLKELPCSCVVCRKKLKLLMEEKYSQEKIDLLCTHNLITAKSYINKIIQYLNFEDYRAFVEKTSLDDTYIISLLRVLDKEYYNYLKNETPITQKVKKVNCLGPYSYNRPDFQAFRERVIERFEPEPGTKLIILLPCSATKPYSESPSHKKFLSVLRKFREFPSFQEIIITSPLGAIPRQLENVYPVNSYDISVTGEWDDEERQITSDMFQDIINKYDKDIPIISHLEGDYATVSVWAELELYLKMVHTGHKGITSKVVLQALENAIQNEIEKENIQVDVDRGITDSSSRKFRKILDYQYGIGSGPKVFPNGVKIRKNRENTQIQLIDPISKTLLGNFRYNTGQIALTLKGAEKLAPFDTLSKYLVFDGERIQGSTLFRPGIIEYGQDLVPDEITLILNKDKTEIIGMGQLFVSSNFIKNSKTGRIAKIYDKK